MNTCLSLADRMKEVFLNGTWVANTNYSEQLKNMDWELAIKKIVPLNTISEISQHMHRNVLGLKNALKIGKLEYKEINAFNFDPILSKEEWVFFLEQFWHDIKETIFHIESLRDEQLYESLIHEKYGTLNRNIEGLLEHAYYHLGQIVIIKKYLFNAS